MDLLMFMLDVAVGPMIFGALLVLVLIIGAVGLLLYLAIKLIIKIKKNVNTDDEL